MKERSTGVASSTYYLPLIRTYADALLRFQKTKPIRGRTPENAKWGGGNNPCVPLGRREDVDNYSIRKGENGNIEFVSYRNAVLTYTPDNRIIIAPRWMSIMESGMIERVLGIDAWLDRRKIGIKIDDERHVLEAGKTLTLKSESDGTQDHLSVLKKDTVFSYYVKRKAANNVRLQYSGFSQYLHGFLQLRKDMEDNSIQISYSEIADCVGYERTEENIWSAGKNMGAKKVWRPDVNAFKRIDEKPQGVRCLWRSFMGSYGTGMMRQWESYQEQTKRFLSMASNDQPEEGKVDNYYRATLTMLGLSLGYMHHLPSDGEDRTVAIPVSRVQKLWDDVVLKYHSDEILDKRELKPNQLPNEKYNRYITIMPTQQEIEDTLKREANI